MCYRLIDVNTCAAVRMQRIGFVFGQYWVRRAHHDRDGPAGWKSVLLGRSWRSCTFAPADFSRQFSHLFGL
jgi:hypothetical protein